MRVLGLLDWVWFWVLLELDVMRLVCGSLVDH